MNHRRELFYIGIYDRGLTSTDWCWPGLSLLGRHPAFKPLLIVLWSWWQACCGCGTVAEAALVMASQETTL